MFRLGTKLAFKPVGISRYLPVGISRYLPGIGAVRTLSEKKQDDPRGGAVSAGEDAISAKPVVKLKYQKAYSKVTMKEAEKRLGFRFRTFEQSAMSVEQMLEEAKPEASQGLGDAEVQSLKERIFLNIIDVISSEGYPIDSDEDFKEAKVNDLVIFTILPIVTAFRNSTKKNVWLEREKEIISVDHETGGFQEFVVIDWIGDFDHKFVFVVEAKKTSVGKAKRQCLLALKDMYEYNGGGVVYGFVTTGSEWQMVRLDKNGFAQTIAFYVVSQVMRTDKEKWMKDYSIIIDCVHTALKHGGMIAGEV
ncbi:hypothetical protein B9Z19DRAFT_517993 [Tuber borchii]|uniref:Uncharacterized protein n=1 Tax=Tuber borchii TaxID=42251 RepID=A0A2T6ZDW9_TUBBO|nr:hypothetical protein B9Z19DRAFT_517993 [Tuber borchii]